MSQKMTVKELGKLITEMKKQGLSNAEVSIESCDGCIAGVKGVEVSKSTKNSVIITAK